MKILAYQPLITQVKSAAQKRAHVRNIVQFLEASCQQEPDIDLILLPELTTIEYSANSFANLSELTEPLLGETFTEMATLAKKVGCAVSYGFPQVKNGSYFISQAVVGPSGECVANYSKLHLAQFGASMEQEYFSRGSKLAVFEWEGVRFGIIICYDFRFSELIRVLVNTHQVDVILHPVAFTKDGSFASWHHFAICRALEYQVYFLSINRAGEMWGNSILCPPWIDDHVQPTILSEKEEAHLFIIDKNSIRAARETYPFRLDKLADYTALEIGDRD